MSYFVEGSSNPPLPGGESLFLLCAWKMMPRADWLLAADLCSILLADSQSRAECSVSAPPGDPATCRCSSHTHTRARAHTHTHTHIHTLTLMSARCVCAHHRLLQPAADFTWANKPGDLTTKQCVHTALCGIAGYYYFCALSGGNGGGVSARAIIMDCLFLLIWTLPIPLVGCTSLRLLSTLLSWNIIKACALYQSCMHPSVKHTHRRSLGPKQTHICLFAAWFVPTSAAAVTDCGEK